MTDVIGTANDIGVENLSAAGLIAGETARAYNDIVTLSMATSRAIGIGAYLVRLGQRVVQVRLGRDSSDSRSFSQFSHWSHFFWLITTTQEFELRLSLTPNFMT